MAGYFGNGYFLKVVQRGAAPVGKPRSRPAQLPVVFEETVTTRASQAAQASAQTSGDSEQTFAAQNESPAYQDTVSSQPLNDDLFVESRGLAAGMTSFESHNTTVPAVTTSSIPEATEQAPSPSAQAITPLEIQDSAIEPSVDTNSYKSFTPAENAHESRSGSRVFELRMPEGFYPAATGEHSRVDRSKPSPRTRLVSTSQEPQVENGATVDHVSAAIPAEVHTQTRREIENAAVPEPADESHDLQIELRHAGPTTEAHETSQTSPLVQEIVAHVTPPSPLLPAEVFESSAPTPRSEQLAEYAPFRQPSITTAPIVPPARLQINRLDIQVINQAPAPPPLPPAQERPDVSQLLEKKHVGRVELLL